MRRTSTLAFLAMLCLAVGTASKHALRGKARELKTRNPSPLPKLSPTPSPKPRPKPRPKPSPKPLPAPSPPCASCSTPTYPIQQNQLAIVTSDGRYCSVYPASFGTVIRCNTTQVPNVVSFSLEAFNLTDTVIKTATTPFKLLMRPFASLPASVRYDGLVSSGFKDDPSMFTLRSGQHPAEVGVDVTMFAAGTPLLYLTVLSNASNTTGPASHLRYCRTSHDGSPFMWDSAANYTVSHMLVCDLPSTTNATLFRLQPLGLAWMKKRMSLRSFQNKQQCGYKWFQKNNSYVTCEDHGTTEYQVPGTNVLRIPKLPMRDFAEFMMQTWIEYELALGYWITDQDSYLVGTHFVTNTTTKTVLPGNAPYISMLKFSNAIADQASGVASDEQKAITQDSQNTARLGGRDTTIRSGDVVLLRSSFRGRYCQVEKGTQRIVCTAKLGDVLKAKDISSYKFVYEEETM